MPIDMGRYSLGPGNATLSVRTRRGGAAAKAGHDLIIHVTDWRGVLEVGADDQDIGVELVADATSLRVQSGTGGVQALSENDKAKIHQTIDDEVLKRRDIEFRSTRTQRAADGKALAGEGSLTLAGVTRGVTFELVVGEDGALRGTAVVTQSRWGMKPYSALLGALKVLDDVEVVVDGNLSSQS